MKRLKQGNVLERVLLGGEGMGAHLDRLIRKSFHEVATSELSLE